MKYDNELITRIKILHEKGVIAHVSTYGGAFYNGVIVELHQTFIVIKDRFNGEIPITFSEIKKAEVFTER